MFMYNITIKYRTGRMKANADGLSRIPCDMCPCCSKQEDLSAQPLRKTVSHVFAGK